MKWKTNDLNLQKVNDFKMTTNNWLNNEKNKCIKDEQLVQCGLIIVILHNVLFHLTQSGVTSPKAINLTCRIG